MSGSRAGAERLAQTANREVLQVGILAAGFPADQGANLMVLSANLGDDRAIGHLGKMLVGQGQTIVAGARVNLAARSRRCICDPRHAHVEFRFLRRSRRLKTATPTIPNAHVLGSGTTLEKTMLSSDQR